MSEDRNSCPRCADYDRVVEEVENLKQQRTKEVKSLLDDCEQTRSQLQKKVTTMTVVAAVTGAVLGKEFVDKVADYIDSFNNATGLNLPTSVGLATPATSPPQPPQQQDKQDEKKEEEKDEEDKGEREPPFLPGTLLPLSPDTALASLDEVFDDSIIDAFLGSSQVSLSALVEEETDEELMEMMELEMALMLDTPPIIEIPLPYEEFIDIPQAAFVPAPSTLTMFLLPLSLVRTRRR